MRVGTDMSVSCTCDLNSSNNVVRNVFKGSIRAVVVHERIAMKHALLRYPLRARKFQPTLVPAQPTLVLL